jgi:RNA recognition motif-containing protein
VRKASNVSAGKGKKAAKKESSSEDEETETKEEENEQADGGQRELFVGNLSYNSDEHALRERFEQYGTITALKVP